MTRKISNPWMDSFVYGEMNFKKLVCAVSFHALIFSFSLPVQAQTTNTWSGSTSAFWGTGSNWTSGVAPVNGGNVIFTGGSNLNTTNDLTG
ncbi:MAG: hypothetical protein EBX90_14595, partial [Betaproteobacteria bacterium]|nr:hypothetical protein [Betaproteobacteria bacterium]